MSDDEPLRISWSKLRIHAECRQKGFLIRSGKSADLKDVRAFLAGNICDRIMRHWLADPVPGRMADMVNQQMEDSLQEVIDNEEGRVKWREKDDKSRIKAKCQKALVNLEPILLKLVVPYRHEAALRFKQPLRIFYLGEPKEVLLTGEMDILLEDFSARHQVYDLKITEDNGYWRKTLGQLTFYDLATKLRTGNYCVVAGLIQPLAEPRVLTFSFTDEDYRQMLGFVHAYAMDYWRSNHDPKEDSKGCSYCQVKHACAKFAPMNLGDGKKRMSLGMSQE